MSAPTYSIGALANAAGVAVSTVRYYERRDLLRPVGRTAHNYRRYDNASLARLRFIRTAQDTGFSLDDIAALLALKDGDHGLCDDVREIISDRLSAIQNEIDRLQQVESVLSRAMQRCENCSPAAGCDTLDELRTAAADDRAEPQTHCGNGKRGKRSC